MTGTLQIKRGKYYCVLDYRDEKGARKRKWISTGLEEKGNKRKATEMLNKIIVEYEQKELQAKTIKGTSQCNILFTNYMRNWLERKKNKTAGENGILFSSGLIAGEGLIGIALAIFAIIKVGDKSLGEIINLGAPLGNIGGVVFFLIIIASIYYFSSKKKKELKK